MIPREAWYRAMTTDDNEDARSTPRDDGTAEFEDLMTQLKEPRDYWREHSPLA